MKIILDSDILIGHFRHRNEVAMLLQLVDLGRRRVVEPAKLKTMANDTLIGLSASSIGAAVVSGHPTDFRVLAGVTPLIWFGGVEQALAAMR